MTHVKIFDCSTKAGIFTCLTHFSNVDLCMDHTIHVFKYVEVYMDRMIHIPWYVDVAAGRRNGGDGDGGDSGIRTTLPHTQGKRIPIAVPLGLPWLP